MQKSLFILTLCALPLITACRTGQGAAVSEPAQGDMQASTEPVEEALDPNDPNVRVCPVTGAMELIDPDTDGMDDGHGDAHDGF